MIAGVVARQAQREGLGAKGLCAGDSVKLGNGFPSKYSVSFPQPLGGSNWITLEQVFGTAICRLAASRGSDWRKVLSRLSARLSSVMVGPFRLVGSGRVA